MYALVEMLHQTMAAKSSTRMRFVMVGHVTGVDVFSLGTARFAGKNIDGGCGIAEHLCR